jgi:hypothetical protein
MIRNILGTIGASTTMLTSHAYRQVREEAYSATPVSGAVYVPVTCPIGGVAKASGGHSRIDIRRNRRSAKPEVRSWQRRRLPKLTVRRMPQVHERELV